MTAVNIVLNALLTKKNITGNRRKKITLKNRKLLRKTGKKEIVRKNK